MHARMKYTELYLIRSLIYVKKIHQFLPSIKKMHRKKSGSLFLPHGVYSIAGSVSAASRISVETDQRIKVFLRTTLC